MKADNNETKWCFNHQTHPRAAHFFSRRAFWSTPATHLSSVFFVPISPVFVLVLAVFFRLLCQQFLIQLSAVFGPSVNNGQHLLSVQEVSFEALHLVSTNLRKGECSNDALAIFSQYFLTVSCWCLSAVE